jgi:hypothetical protein
MHTDDLFGQHLSMARPTVHRIEATPVPAFRTNVAVEAFCQAVRRAFEVSQINFMAVITGILLLSVGRVQPEQQAGD